MSAAKHTPGPWTFRLVEPAQWSKCGYGATVEGKPIDGGHPVVADLPPRTRDGTHEANAHLIAAAPDLLEVARHIDAAYRAIYGGADLLAADHPSMALWAEARAAIAKATGEQS